MNPPYWKTCKLSPDNDAFKLMYQDWDNGFVHIGNISMYDKQITLFPDLSIDIIEDDAINRFLDSLDWKISPINDTKEHRNFLLEFHLANTDINSDYIRVHYPNVDGKFNSKTWEICRYDDHIEITNPLAKSSIDIKRFRVQEHSIKEILNWIITDIENACGKETCIWIDFGNR